MSATDHTFTGAAESVPPHLWFGVSAVFHYLGPSFAVLLFPAVGVLGVAWLRIVSAALLFMPWTRPWHTFRESSLRQRWLLGGLGLCLAAMNCSFYLALDRLPMSLVAAMEFLGVIGIALCGLATVRNFAALGLAMAGVFILIEVRWATDAPGIAWATLNSVLFAAYIVLGHQAAAAGATSGVARLGAAMSIAMIFVMPIGIFEAIKAFGSARLMLAGIGVGICSSVIPYVCDQLAMSRLRRETFALLVSLLPASATIIAAIVLAQIPTLPDIFGIVLVMTGIALHRSAPIPPAQTVKK